MLGQAQSKDAQVELWDKPWQRTDRVRACASASPIHISASEWVLLQKTMDTDIFIEVE